MVTRHLHCIERLVYWSLEAFLHQQPLSWTLRHGRPQVRRTLDARQTRSPGEVPPLLWNRTEGPAKARLAGTVDDLWNLLLQRSHAATAGNVVELESQPGLASVVIVVRRVVTDHVEHVQTGAGIVDEVVLVFPVHSGHHITRLVVLRKVE